MKRLVLGIATLVTVSLLNDNGWSQTWDEQQIAKVQTYLFNISSAYDYVEKHDLAKLEALLEPAFLEIESMSDTFPIKPAHQFEAQKRLRQHNWGQLVWTQLMYRLLAIREGIYDEELRFAERVPLEKVARESFTLVETSVARIQKLLEAKEKFGLGPEIDEFAQGMFTDGPRQDDYEQMVVTFRDRFAERRNVVLARLRSGHHKRMIDPADLPLGTRYAATYDEHREMLESENRLHAIVKGLAEFDAEKIRVLSFQARHDPSPEIREKATYELKLQLLLLEDSLEASEGNASLNGMIVYVNEIRPLVMESWETYGPEDDFQELVRMVSQAQRNLHEESKPEALRLRIAMSDAVR